MFETTHSGILAKFETKAKKAGTVQVLALKFESAGEDQGFLDDLPDQEPPILDTKNVPALFRLPVAWKGLSFEFGHVVHVELHDVADPTKLLASFRALLRGVKVARAWKHGVDVFTYTVLLEKDIGPDVDKDLVHFVNAKMRNARTDKMEPILWPWTFEALEGVACSVDPDGGDGAGAAE